jgi:hypothetical protein
MNGRTNTPSPSSVADCPVATEYSGGDDACGDHACGCAIGIIRGSGRRGSSSPLIGILPLRSVD